MTSSRRIFLIHATPVAITPINDAFSRLWPEAELCNLLEDSLSRDLAKAGALTEGLKQRFLDLATYARGAGAEGILFTCSAFGEAIDLCKGELDIPVLKPNEAMIEEALGVGARVAVLATFEPAISSMTEEFLAAAQAYSRDVDIRPYSAPEALDALRDGDVARHDSLIAEMAASVVDCDVLCFAQFSMTSAGPGVQRANSLPLLTTPDSAVFKLRKCLQA